MKQNEQITKLIESANELNAVVLHIVKHKNDDYLFECLCERHNGFNTEYVVWIYNADVDGFANGYYTQIWENAVNKLNERIAR